ncbi:MAG: XRE family transcriptional regulator [Deltaproteobacteria bacterium]|nr:XRE family transcriptional regulator [Deltaproteobacteria bacterium]
MKIKKVRVDNRKKRIEIETTQGSYSLPFCRLRLKPKPNDKIKEIYVDRDLGHKGVTYVLDSGREDSIHMDAFLDFNKDPRFLRDVALHQLTISANKLIQKSGLSKQEIIRRLRTSPSQLYRLLDPSNYQKSIDEMLRLLAVLGCTVEWKVLPEAA